MGERLWLLRITLVLTLLVAGCARGDRQGAPSAIGDWQTASLSEVDVKGGPLDDLAEVIDEAGYGIDAVLIVRHGKLVYERYWDMRPSELHSVYSCTKSIVSLLVGIALFRGDLESADQTIGELLPDLDWKQLGTDKKAITLGDLLTMSSGLDWPELGVPYDAASTFSRWTRTGGRARFVLERDIVHEPGSVFNYTSGGSHVISAILAAQTGQNTSDYAQEHLFAPLGIKRYEWPTDSDGLSFGGHALKLRPRDMAKIGQLALDGGQWQDQQIVSPEWVSESTRQHIMTGRWGSYGYHWWVYPGLAPTSDGIEAFGAMGYRGQHIYVIPDKDMVVVFASTLDPNDTISAPRTLLEQYILPAAR